MELRSLMSPKPSKKLTLRRHPPRCGRHPRLQPPLSMGAAEEDGGGGGLDAVPLPDMPHLPTAGHPAAPPGHGRAVPSQPYLSRPPQPQSIPSSAGCQSKHPRSRQRRAGLQERRHPRRSEAMAAVAPCAQRHPSWQVSRPSRGRRRRRVLRSTPLIEVRRSNPWHRGPWRLRRRS
ncbi:hypothetical protein SETIT_9G178600v2 [Setaria italica]|uniref:Uncharacterized protein n=1 Tax=Setaria italica TaxID=4555 RepID=A0A368SHR8_SETIT|nr:hypothetical protein SETIT_9G178600v2 [Setaria italica]